MCSQRARLNAPSCGGPHSRFLCSHVAGLPRLSVHLDRLHKALGRVIPCTSLPSQHIPRLWRAVYRDPRAVKRREVQKAPKMILQDTAEHEASRQTAYCGNCVQHSAGIPRGRQHHRQHLHDFSPSINRSGHSHSRRNMNDRK